MTPWYQWIRDLKIVFVVASVATLVGTLEPCLAQDGDSLQTSFTVAQEATRKATERQRLEKDFFRAITKGDAKQVKALIAAGADVNARPNGDTALNVAILWNGDTHNIEVIKLLIAAKEDINVEVSDGLTPLSRAIMSGYNDIVKLLIAAKANVNYQSKNDNGFTALMTAAMHGNTGGAKLLIDAGAKVDVKDINGRTALYWAAENGNTGVAKHLIDAGADVNVRNDSKTTPLIKAAGAVGVNSGAGVV